MLKTSDCLQNFRKQSAFLARIFALCRDTFLQKSQFLPIFDKIVKKLDATSRWPRAKDFKFLKKLDRYVDFAQKSTRVDDRFIGLSTVLVHYLNSRSMEVGGPTGLRSLGEI